MTVAIIGAGFGGLAAAYELVRAGVKVIIFEASANPGGLAGGFFDHNWQWSVDYHYHHIFKNDQAIKLWLKELDLIDDLFFQDTNTYSLTKSTPTRIAKLDSALSLLSYPDLSLVSKLRTGAVLAGLKALPKGEKLEKYTAQQFLRAAMGRQSWENLWEPLFSGKFDKDAGKVNAAWFWARIYARSKKLGYFKKGFLGLAQQITAQLEELGVEFKFLAEVKSIKLARKKAATDHNKLLISLGREKYLFDSAIFTGSSQQLLQVAQDNFPASYVSELQDLESLAAMTLILVLNKPFFDQDIYWLNINRSNWPFLAVVEHTNFINKAHYSNQHLVYVGKYLSAKDNFYQKSKKEILAAYQPYLNKLSPNFKQHLLNSYLIKNEGAQPLVKKNHSLVLPKVKTPLANLYWSSMQHVYPSDRGVNYAVQLGRDTAQSILIEK